MPKARPTLNDPPSNASLFSRVPGSLPILWPFEAARAVSSRASFVLGGAITPQA